MKVLCRIREGTTLELIHSLQVVKGCLLQNPWMLMVARFRNCLPNMENLQIKSDKFWYDKMISQSCERNTGISLVEKLSAQMQEELQGINLVFKPASEAHHSLGSSSITIEMHDTSVTQLLIFFLKNIKIGYQMNKELFYKLRLSQASMWQIFSI